MNRVFPIVRKGYDQQEVKRYIEELENSLSYYKERESAITKAVINAEVTAENIVEDAELKAKEIEREAHMRLGEIKEKTVEVKEKLEIFQKKYNMLIQDYLVTLRSDELVELFNDLDDITDFLEPKKDEVNIKDDESEEDSY